MNKKYVILVVLTVIITASLGCNKISSEKFLDIKYFFNLNGYKELEYESSITHKDRVEKWILFSEKGFSNPILKNRSFLGEDLNTSNVITGANKFSGAIVQFEADAEKGAYYLKDKKNYLNFRYAVSDDRRYLYIESW